MISINDFKKDFNKIFDWLWEISKSFRLDMRVPARTKNLANLPFAFRCVVIMPDTHIGFVYLFMI